MKSSTVQISDGVQCISQGHFSYLRPLLYGKQNFYYKFWFIKTGLIE